MNYHEQYIEYLVTKGGPDLSDYGNLDAWIFEVNDLIRDGILSSDDKIQLMSKFGDAFSEKTMQGFAYKKPHGYAGDFEIIDRIYSRYEAKENHLKKWDIYWQSHAAANAVRNRNDYFADILKSKEGLQKSIKVLNVASGPGRDMYNFFSMFPSSTVKIDCVEQDENAIRHAKEVCSKFLTSISFVRQNALKIRLETKYNLIWSAGLFDY